MQSVEQELKSAFLCGIETRLQFGLNVSLVIVSFLFGSLRLSLARGDGEVRESSFKEEA